MQMDPTLGDRRSHHHLLLEPLRATIHTQGQVKKPQMATGRGYRLKILSGGFRLGWMGCPA